MKYYLWKTIFGNMYALELINGSYKIVQILYIADRDALSRIGSWFTFFNSPSILFSSDNLDEIVERAALEALLGKMKYYIRKTTWSDILLLTLTEEPKTDSGLSQFKLKSVLYDSGGNYSSGYLLRYYMKDVIEFDTREEAIA